jgi:hypothetical protein
MSSVQKCTSIYTNKTKENVQKERENEGSERRLTDIETQRFFADSELSSVFFLLYKPFPFGSNFSGEYLSMAITDD